MRDEPQPTPPERAILRIDGLTVGHAGQAPLAVGWSTSIGAGVTLLHGDTGSGKSTLLRGLAGLMPPTHGDLTVAGISLAADAAAYRRQVFLADPDDARHDALPARDLAALLGDGDERFSRVRWQALTDGFALTPHLDKPVYMLSTGTRRKLWLAAALACGRPLVLLDEPGSGLDAAALGCLWNALGDATGQGEQAIVVASGERLARVPRVTTIELPLR